jgi:hypothetical protein
MTTLNDYAALSALVYSKQTSNQWGQTPLICQFGKQN